MPLVPAPWMPNSRDVSAPPRRISAQALLILVGDLGPAAAIESSRVPLDAAAIDLTHAVESYSSQGDRLLVSTAPGSDGIVRRIEVRARDAGTRPNWIVFALTNDSDEQIERLIVAPHFRLVGSGVIWPDLGATRLSAITASQGNSPEREDSSEADVFRLTLDPGTTVTYVAELATPNLPQLTLWEPDAYKDKLTSLTLYKGIVIGIAGLLALFLTIVFVVKGAVIFPAAAALAWAVLAYVCIDFGFWDKLFGTSGGERPGLARRRRDDAGGDAARVPLRLPQSQPLARAGFARRHRLADLPRRAHRLRGSSTRRWRRASPAFRSPPVAAVGFILVLYLSTHGYDRAVMLIPTWFLLLAWVICATFTVTGHAHERPGGSRADRRPWF